MEGKQGSAEEREHQEGSRDKYGGPCCHHARAKPIVRWAHGAPRTTPGSPSPPGLPPLSLQPASGTSLLLGFGPGPSAEPQLPPRPSSAAHPQLHSVPGTPAPIQLPCQQLAGHRLSVPRAALQALPPPSPFEEQPSPLASGSSAFPGPILPTWGLCGAVSPSSPLARKEPLHPDGPTALLTSHCQYLLRPPSPPVHWGPPNGRHSQLSPGPRAQGLA